MFESSCTWRRFGSVEGESEVNGCFGLVVICGDRIVGVEFGINSSVSGIESSGKRAGDMWTGGIKYKGWTGSGTRKGG